MMGDMMWLWIGFNVFVLGMLALDLGVFHRHSHTVSMKEAVTWSVVWISLALLFNLGIYLFWHQIVPSSAYSNSEAAIAFLTGYLIEKSLSVDNIFVFVLLFIPRFEYNAVILCEPVIWCFMTIELLIAYRHNSFVFPKMKK